MIAATITTFALLLGAVVAAMSLTWRRHRHQPAKVLREVDGPTCHPRVRL